MIHVDQGLCPKNHLCPTIKLCPAGAISQRPDKASEVDHDKCTGCNRCIMSCRVFRPEQIPTAIAK